MTGANQYFGRPVALALGSQGATVYLTARKRAHEDQLAYEMLCKIAEAITAAGGVGIAIACDQANDHQVRALFEQIESEQGHLDILVNEATNHMSASDVGLRRRFWEQDSLERANEITLGLRLAYLSSSYAAPLLMRSEKALIANLSSATYDDVAYSATKAGLDRMTWHMAQQFQETWGGTGVAVVSIDVGKNRQLAGHVIDALYSDPDLMTKSGQTVIGAEVAASYGLS